MAFAGPDIFFFVGRYSLVSIWVKVGRSERRFRQVSVRIWGWSANINSCTWMGDFEATIFIFITKIPPFEIKKGN